VSREQESEPNPGTRSTGEYSVGALVVIFLKGVAMGSADAVPGISGGTIALITGIYERLIRALTALDPSVLRELPALHRGEHRMQVWRDLVRMDVPFLLVLGTGMVTAVVVLARVVQIALDTAPGVTFGFFSGLIGASAFALFERRMLATPGRILAAIAGFSLAFLVAGQTVDGILTPSLPFVFVAGALAISGMVLPGISGAFILLLLGQYDFMTATLNDFVDGLVSLTGGGISAEFAEATTVVVTFVGGALVGLMTVAYAVRAALERYRGATFAFLVSLMMGALRYPIVQIGDSVGGWRSAATAAVVLAVLAGGGVVLVLDRYTDDLDYEGV